MRDTYPTARFLGILAAGDFTAPVRELLQNRGIDLFYVPKAKLVTAFADCGLKMDYPDDSSEEAKSKIAQTFQDALTVRKKKAVAKSLRKHIGEADLDSYVHRVRAALGALPQEIRLYSRKTSPPVTFDSTAEASLFLESPHFSFDAPTESFAYEITYSDGSTFERDVATISQLRELHARIESMVVHVESLVGE
jgi:hypothetical protein